jgi:hypothetical protein
MKFIQTHIVRSLFAKRYRKLPHNEHNKQQLIHTLETVTRNVSYKLDQTNLPSWHCFAYCEISSYLMCYSMLSKFIFIRENATNDRYLSRYNPRSRGIPSVLLLNSICWLKCTRELQTQKRSLHRMIKLFFLQASLSLIFDGNSSDNDSIQGIKRTKKSFQKVKLVRRLSESPRSWWKWVNFIRS